MPDIPSYPQRRSPRLAGYDYMTAGWYFVTICVQDRLPLLGSIENGAMRLSPAGQMADDEWRHLTSRHPGVAVDVIGVMPDHVHVIVVLEDDPRRTLSLTAVIQRYKSQTTKAYAHGVRDHAWPRFADKLWQESFYDHAIRADEKLEKVRRYIVENPARWELRRGKSD